MFGGDAGSVFGGTLAFGASSGGGLLGNTTPSTPTFGATGRCHNMLNYEERNKYIYVIVEVDVERNKIGSVGLKMICANIGLAKS